MRFLALDYRVAYSLFCGTRYRQQNLYRGAYDQVYGTAKESRIYHR